MKTYLQVIGGWTLFEGDLTTLEPELNARVISIGDGANIDQRARIGNGATIGLRAYVGKGALIGNGARIGNDACVCNCAQVGNDANIGRRAHIGKGAFIGNSVRIGEDALIGDGVIISDYAVIGDGAVIQKTADCLVLAPFGVRDNVLTAYVIEGTIYVTQGCFVGTVSAFERAMVAMHETSEHARRYAAAVAFFRAVFTQQ
jgi:UDP-3-O-[3-hydroxymyristoyl] glucosamine N-acyltransferase